MNKKDKKIIFISSFFILVLASMFTINIVKRWKCVLAAQNLLALGVNLDLYKEKHNGNLPISLEELTEEFPHILEIIGCKSKQDITSCSKFEYMGNNSIYSIEGKKVIAYEKEMKHRVVSENDFKKRLCNILTFGIYAKPVMNILLDNGLITQANKEDIKNFSTNDDIQ